jgi:hypothetical protein
MVIKDLSRLDVAYTGADGVTGLVAVATDWEPESLRLAQLAVKLTAMRAYGANREPYRIEVACYEADPPRSVIAVVALVGGVVKGADGRLVPGRPGVFGDSPDWPTVHAANAALFAKRHALNGSVESLRRVDDLLAAAFEASAGAEDGDLAMLAGSYASQVMLAAFGGSWLPAAPLPDLRVSLGPAGELTVAAFGKVRKFLQNGPEDSVYYLARVVGERLNAA